MTRNRAETAQPPLTVRNNSGPIPASSAGPANGDAHESGGEGASAVKHLPSIRFIPHQDPRAGRPSLQFPTINRTLPDESAIIRVGRYSERDNTPENTPSMPSAAAVGFKSKVVSRKHCELWCKDGSWYIKDVKSSSGTFLNHIRLSQPNVESKPFRIKDGDIIQLGIDFRGGEEMIFRCVKIRVECNRGWQQGLNKFK
jgi:pSer/pThr/pTyr-binding forkhead associated (FHA) protein